MVIFAHLVDVAHLAVGDEPGLEGAQAHDAGRVAHRAAVGLVPHQRHLTGQDENFQCKNPVRFLFLCHRVVWAEPSRWRAGAWRRP